jgi:Ca2+/Na+ antiporter
MEISTIILISIFFIGLMLAIFFMVKGFSQIGWLHGLLWILLYIQCIVFLIFTGGTHAIKLDQVQRFAELSEINRDQRQAVDKIKYGDLKTPTKELSNLTNLNGEIDRIALERGRVWRGVRRLDFSNNVASVEVLAAPLGPQNPIAAPVDPNAPPAAATPPSLIADTVVYAFGEAPDADGRMIPVVYLGEFFTTEIQGSIAKLTPTIQLTPRQLGALNDAQLQSWSIYDVIPIDDHRALSVPGSTTTEAELFGRMDPAALATLLGIDEALLQKAPSDMTPLESRQAEVLRSYVLDGQRAPEGTLPESIWWKIRFLQDFTENVDSVESRGLEGGYFDINGFTIDARLKLGDQKNIANFKKDDEIVFAREAADALVKQGIAQKLEDVYVRPLNDYAYLFKQLQLRANKAEQDIDTTKREIERTDRTLKVGQSQIVVKQGERKRLDDDLGQVTKEKSVATSEVERVEADVAALRSELSDLYKSSQQLYKRLIQTQQKIAGMVN